MHLSHAAATTVHVHGFSIREKKAGVTMTYLLIKYYYTLWICNITCMHVYYPRVLFCFVLF